MSHPLNTRKIRILHLGSSSGLYGAERWILALLKNLDPDTTDSWVGAIRDEKDGAVPLLTEARKLNISTHMIEAYGRFNFSAAKKLKKFITAANINILHTHGYKTDIIGLIATRGTSCKIISTPHGWTKQPDLKLWIYEALDRIILRFLDGVAPLSEELFHDLTLIPGLNKNLHFIRNGVDTSEIDTTDKVSGEISSLKSQGKTVIGYIGRLTSGKGLDTLFNAVAKYADPEWHVAIVGEGEQEAHLKSMVQRLNIADKVTFFGFRQDRLAFLNGFDIFVLPSKSEGIPRCLMEAMAAKVPVLASDIPGCRQLIKNEETGLLFQLDNERALAEGIKRLTSNIFLGKKLSKRARNHILSQFSAVRMAQEYTVLYNRLS